MNIVFVKKIKINLWDYYKGLFKGIIPALLLSFVCGYLFHLLPINGWLGFFAGVAVMSIAYFAFMMLFGMSNYEKKLLFSAVRKVLKVKSSNYQ